MNPFKSFIEHYTELAASDWEKISTLVKSRQIAKGAILLEEGKICRHLYFLEKGLLRYYLMKDGNDITKFFTDAPYTFTSQVSFTAQLPAKESIEALEDCILCEMTLESANMLLELKSWNTFIRKLVQEVQFYTESILSEIQTETAETRYIKMLTKNPELIRRISVKHLASYFGIAPQSLSRIRKKILTPGKK
jgi:CRP-like cAMP-binding protein